MATITPAFTVTAEVPRLTWTGVSTADTMSSTVVVGKAGLAGALQLSGTWGGATVTLKGSNDDVTYFTLKDVFGNNISATADAEFEFSTGVAYLKPASSGGAGDNVDVIIVMRG